MSVFKRNAVILTVLLFVCAAVYLNWAYNKATDIDTPAGASANASALPEASPTGQGEASSLYYSGGEETQVSNSEYFAQARLTRQTARDEAKETFQSLSESAETGSEESQKALDSISRLAEYTVLEAEVETLIIAKGFSDCVAFISEDGINITVPAGSEGLSDSDVARITDIVTAETDFAPTQLQIIEIK